MGRKETSKQKRAKPVQMAAPQKEIGIGLLVRVRCFTKLRLAYTGRGSELTAACGGRKEASEWPRSKNRGNAYAR